MTDAGITKAQLRYLADVPEHPPGRRPYGPHDKRMYPKLLDMGLIKVVSTSGIGRSAVAYYTLTEDGARFVGNLA